MTSNKESTKDRAQREPQYCRACNEHWLSGGRPDCEACGGTGVEPPAMTDARLARFAGNAARRLEEYLRLHGPAVLVQSERRRLLELAVALMHSETSKVERRILNDIKASLAAETKP